MRIVLKHAKSSLGCKPLKLNIEPSACGVVCIYHFLLVTCGTRDVQAAAASISF